MDGTNGKQQKLDAYNGDTAAGKAANTRHEAETAKRAALALQKARDMRGGTQDEQS